MKTERETIMSLLQDCQDYAAEAQATAQRIQQLLNLVGLPKDEAPTKRCSRCHEAKPLDGFWKDKSKPDGISPTCRDCLNSGVPGTRNTAPAADSGLLSVQQVAQQLGVGRAAIYTAVRSGEIPSVKVGRLYRVPASYVKAMRAAV